MRRDEDKAFKGSVFVEFTEQAGVEAFLTADPKPKFGDEELLCMTKYVAFFHRSTATERNLERNTVL